jgi:hypothetical protein
MGRWRAAETYTGSAQMLINEREWHRKRIGQAVAMGDVDYMGKCAESLQYLLELEKGEADDSKVMSRERYIIEGYRWLRITNGRGSPLPNSREILQEATRLCAYYKMCWRKGHQGSTSYRGYLEKAKTDRRFRERVEGQIANAQRSFDLHHSERLLTKLGLEDLIPPRGRPTRKGSKCYSGRKSPTRKSPKK